MGRRQWLAAQRVLFLGAVHVANLRLGRLAWKAPLAAGILGWELQTHDPSQALSIDCTCPFASADSCVGSGHTHSVMTAKRKIEAESAERALSDQQEGPIRSRLMLRCSADECRSSVTKNSRGRPVSEDGPPGRHCDGCMSGQQDLPARRFPRHCQPHVRQNRWAQPHN